MLHEFYMGYHYPGDAADRVRLFERDVGPCEERCHTLGRCLIGLTLHYAVRALGVELQVES